MGYREVGVWVGVWVCDQWLTRVPLWDLMDCSTPGFSVLHYLWIVIFMSIELVMLSNHLFSVLPILFVPIFPSSVSFPMTQLFVSGGQSIEASTSVLPMNIQGGFPLGLTILISLQAKALSRVFSFCLQSFPASGYFPVSQLFASEAKLLELQLQSFQ